MCFSLCTNVASACFRQRYGINYDRDVRESRRHVCHPRIRAKPMPVLADKTMTRGDKRLPACSSAAAPSGQIFFLFSQRMPEARTRRLTANTAPCVAITNVTPPAKYKRHPIRTGMSVPKVMNKTASTSRPRLMGLVHFVYTCGVERRGAIRRSGQASTCEIINIKRTIDCLLKPCRG